MTEETKEPNVNETDSVKAPAEDQGREKIPAKPDTPQIQEPVAEIPKEERLDQPAAKTRIVAMKGGCFRRILIALIIFVLLGAIAAGIGVMEIQSRLLPVTDMKKKIVVTVPTGANARDIGILLHEKGVIRDADIFRHYVAYKKVGPKLKAGEHVLDASSSTPQIVESLIRGNFKLYSLTIPEGLTMTQIASLAAQAGFVDEKVFLSLCRNKDFIQSVGLDDADTLEGYLFPETYNFIRGVSTEEVVKTLVNRFWTVWKRYEADAEKSDLSRKEIITLASIIEKETGAGYERPMIAGVFLNRMKKGMRLETDPTVIYGIKDFNGNLTKKDLQTPTPYNTYIIEGLPPGPIANPGEDSIKAVLHPAQVDFLFFVSKNDGTHQFSSTLAEHNKAVNHYQRKRKKNKK